MILGTINGSELYCESLETYTDLIYHSIFICCKILYTCYVFIRTHRFNNIFVHKFTATLALPLPRGNYLNREIRHFAVIFLPIQKVMHH